MYLKCRLCNLSTSRIHSDKVFVISELGDTVTNYTRKRAKKIFKIHEKSVEKVQETRIKRRNKKKYLHTLCPPPSP